MCSERRQRGALFGTSFIEAPAYAIRAAALIALHILVRVMTIIMSPPVFSSTNPRWWWRENAAAIELPPFRTAIVSARNAAAAVASLGPCTTSGWREPYAASVFILGGQNAGQALIPHSAYQVLGCSAAFRSFHDCPPQTNRRQVALNAACRRCWLYFRSRWRPVIRADVAVSTSAKPVFLRQWNIGGAAKTAGDQLAVEC